MRRVYFWVGTALLALGAFVLVVAGAIYALGLYDDLTYEDAYPTPSSIVEALPTPAATATLAPTPSPTSPTALPVTPSAVGTAAPATLTPTPTSTPPVGALAEETAVAPNPQPAIRIKAPSIGLDAPATESVIRNGQWTVPKFAAGHLQGTAQPGGPGNAVFAGHVSSISSGDVFRNIGKLKVGDPIVVVTKAGELRYEVSEKIVVKNTDLSVTRDKGDERVTLITCTGTWLPLRRDYDRRLIIFAVRVW